MKKQLYELSVHKSIGPDVIHPRVLRELRDVRPGPFPPICQRSREATAGLNLDSVTLISKREEPENRPAGLTSGPGKVQDIICYWKMLKEPSLYQAQSTGVHEGNVLP